MKVVPPLLHSLLFAPGNRPEIVAKASRSRASVTIIDLEDAVPEAEKAVARGLFNQLADDGPPLMVRINGSDSPHFRSDLSVLTHKRLTGVILPKAEYPEQIAEVRCATALPVFPLIESAAGLHNIDAIAGCRGVKALTFGSFDLQADMGMNCLEEELLYFRSRIVLASRIAGLNGPVDSVCSAIDDAAKVRLETERARRLGFSGKLCIHPRQVDITNACFRATEEELDWARRIVEADARSGGAAVKLDGEMVDRPIVLRARAILNTMETGHRR
jgi:citrate lyase subunit beta/citryl-CoA lyase